MSDYSSCPHCGYVPRASLTVAFMKIYCCGACHTKYCYKCNGSNGGTQCPKCRSDRYQTIGKCYAK